MSIHSFTVVVAWCSGYAAGMENWLEKPCATFLKLP